MLLSVWGIVPLAILIWFIVSLVLFIKCPDEDTDRRKKLKIMLIVSGVVLGLLILAIIALIIILSLAIMNM